MICPLNFEFSASKFLNKSGLGLTFFVVHALWALSFAIFARGTADNATQRFQHPIAKLPSKSRVPA